MTRGDFFDLIRVPNVVTAISDVLAAWALAGALTETPLRLGTLALTMAASAALYSGGMALNDVADAQLDARERPQRPIPSGRVHRNQAAAVTVALLGTGLVLARLVGWAPFVGAAALVGAILLYDMVLAGRLWGGPLGMAACRALNMTMGLVAARSVKSIPDVGWIGVVLLAIYVANLTRLSLDEVSGSRRSAVVTAAGIFLAVMFSVVIVAVSRVGTFGTLHVAALSVALGGWLFRGAWPLLAAWRQPIAPRVGAAIGGMVSGILWLDAALATATGPWPWLGAFLILALVQELLRRRFPVT